MSNTFVDSLLFDDSSRKFLVMFGSFPGLNQYLTVRIKCLAQEHNSSSDEAETNDLLISS